MDKKEVEGLLDTAISEINYALKSHKSKEVKEFYLENAIRFINRAKEKLIQQKCDDCLYDVVGENTAIIILECPICGDTKEEAQDS